MSTNLILRLRLVFTKCPGITSTRLSFASPSVRIIPCPLTSYFAFGSYSLSAQVLLPLGSASLRQVFVLYHSCTYFSISFLLFCSASRCPYKSSHRPPIYHKNNLSVSILWLFYILPCSSVIKRLRKKGLPQNMIILPNMVKTSLMSAQYPVEIFYFATVPFSLKTKKANGFHTA